MGIAVGAVPVPVAQEKVVRGPRHRDTAVAMVVVHGDGQQAYPSEPVEGVRRAQW